MKLLTPQLFLFLFSFYFGTNELIAQQITLRNITSTDRISSNHYSDLVLLEDGSSYIACFQKNKSGKDEIYICKIDKAGNVKWQLGIGVQGRATAIAKDPTKGIWVTGFYRGTWHLDTHHHHSTEEKVFVLHLDSLGKQLHWIENNQGSAKAYNIAANSIGEIMIHGDMEKKVGFGKSEITVRKERSFIAVFHSNGACKELIPFDGEITEIQSLKSSFIVTGRFHSSMSLSGQTYATTGPLDNDGFIACYRENKPWFYQFGNSGFVKNGYRTLEGGMGLVIDESNKIYVLGIRDSERYNPLEQPNHRFASVVLITMDAEGKYIDEKMMVNRAIAKSPVTLSKDSQGNYWVSAGVQGKVSICGTNFVFGSQPRALLFSCTPSLDLSNIISMEHGPNTMIRSSFSMGNKVAFTGHFKECLIIGDQSIYNDGKHALFFLGLDL
jgi:hypothetical protein